MTLVQSPTVNLTKTLPTEEGWHRETSFLRSYPAKGEPNILVIGAYNGTITHLLLDQIPDALYFLFEPQDWAYKQLEERFRDRPNFGIYPFGLGDRSGIFPMGLYRTDGCSFMQGGIVFKPDEEYWCQGALVEFDKAMEEIGIRSIYYASLNIEAYEYVLLSYMAKISWLEKCQCLGISWHDTPFHSVVPGPYMWLGQPVPSYQKMQELLSRTHSLVLEIDNWQSWVRREL